MVPSMLATLLMLFTVLGGPAAPARPLDISADRLELDDTGRTMVFVGNVEASQGKLRLRCARLDATYSAGPKRKLLSLRASGGVHLKSDGLSARAETATYDRSKGTIVLEGSPSATRAGNTLTGERIVLWPDRGKMVVERPRGRLRAPKLDGLYGPR